MKNKTSTRTKIIDIKACLNPNLFRVLAIWVPHGVSATWATLHYSVIPSEWVAYARAEGEKPGVEKEQDHGNV
jgi:hypothetical protein